MVCLRCRAYGGARGPAASAPELHTAEESGDLDYAPTVRRPAGYHPGAAATLASFLITLENIGAQCSAFNAGQQPL